MSEQPSVMKPVGENPALNAPRPPLVDPVPDAPPAPIAEAGVTTSEWRALKLYAAQLAGVGTATVAAKLGLNLSPDALGLIVSLELLAVVGVSSYILSRGIRKKGTAA